MENAAADEAARHVRNQNGERVMKLCAAPGCDRKHAAHGYCNMHRQRMLREGHLELKSSQVKELNQQTLQQLLHYQADTGIFTWKVKIKGCVNPGDIAGCIDKQGYRVIRIFNKNRKAHRLAWLYVYGEQPKLLDHIDRNRSNNAISNLRIATQRENTINRSSLSNNASGFTGVLWHAKAKKWEAMVTVKGQRIYLGLFTDPFEAAQAREQYCQKNLGEFYKSDLRNTAKLLGVKHAI
jgi:hypothetical protein